MIKYLNLFAGIGGNTYLLDRDHFEITHVEINKKIAAINQKLNPSDKIIIGNAYKEIHNFEKYDFIWSSPPCQSHSLSNKFLHYQGIKRLPDLKFYGIILYLRQFAKNKKWIVENVQPYYNYLINPSFEYGRHAYWSNYYFSIKPINKNFNYTNAKKSSRLKTKEYKEKLINWLELPSWLKDVKSPTKSNSGLQYLTNCVHPKEGKEIISAAITEQLSLDDTFTYSEGYDQK